MLNWPLQYFTAQIRDALGKEKGEISRYIYMYIYHIESFAM